MSKQISKDNREYWSNKLRTKFSDKKEAVESQHRHLINERSEKNYSIFKKRLRVQKELDDMLKFEKDFNQYRNNYHTILEQKRHKLRKSFEKFSSKMADWQENRKLWNNDDIPDFDEKRENYFIVEECDKWLKGLCKHETKKAFYNSKEGQVLKKLDELREEAEDLLHSDMIGSEVLKQISLIARKTDIKLTIPSETVKALSNG